MYDENTAAMKIQACYKTYSTRKQLVRCLKSALEEFEMIDRSLGDFHSVEELYNPTDHFLFKSNIYSYDMGVDELLRKLEDILQEMRLVQELISKGKIS